MGTHSPRGPADRGKIAVMLAEPWAIAAGVVIAAEVAAYVHHERRRRRREHDARISRRALDQLNGRRS
jgi:hypothetical protein